MSEHNRTDSLGFEEFSQRKGEGTPYAATLTCVPIGDMETGSLWQGYVKFDNDAFNWRREFEDVFEGASFVQYTEWVYPREVSSGAHMMNLLDSWWREIVELLRRVQESAVFQCLNRRMGDSSRPCAVGGAAVSRLNIPPVTVAAEDAPPPPENAFRKQPVERMAAGDLLLLRGNVWRVKHVQRRRTTPRISLTLWPVQGGRPVVEAWFPREWLPVYR